jgi:hypothetical protein
VGSLGHLNVAQRSRLRENHIAGEIDQRQSGTAEPIAAIPESVSTLDEQLTTEDDPRAETLRFEQQIRNL